MNEDRAELIRRLGNKCVSCNEHDLNVLHLDHRFGQGYVENEYFKSKDEMYSYYLKYFEFESPFLQVLCINCNTKKRIAKKENAGRIPLNKFLEYFIDSLTRSNVNEAKNRLENFPQFVPIVFRVAKNWKSFLERYSDFEWKEPEYPQNLTKFEDKLLTNSRKDVLKSDSLPLLKDEILIKTLTELEGSMRKSVEYRLLVKHLMNTKKFTQNSASDMIYEFRREKRIFESEPGFYNTMNDDTRKQIEVRRMEKEKKHQEFIEANQLFWNILHDLETIDKHPIEEKQFVSELIKSGKFTEEVALKRIRFELRVANIYESKPGHYNRV